MNRAQMMKTVSMVVLAIAVLTSINPVEAGTPRPFASTGSIQTVSDTAGATLLGPYFEVDLSNPTGMNTIFTVNNMGATMVTVSGNFTFTNPSGPTAVLGHVVIWSDLGVPVFNFNIYLTGYDVERIDMRKVLNGLLPQTASAGQDPSDILSPKGPLSQDINFASCNKPQNYVAPLNSFPVFLPGPLSLAQINNLQTSLTGQASVGASGKCAGANHNDNIARGYMTIDTVNNCTARFPGDPGYIGASGSGDATNQTQLTGEVFYVDQLHAIARGNNMVHIHADTADPLTNTSGNYTFYGRYDGFTAIDNRQPLPTSFGARYLNGNFTGAAVTAPTSPAWGAPPTSPPPGSTSLIVWRDSKVAQAYFTCGSLPSPYPLGQEGITAFDEQEHPQVVTSVNNVPLFTFGPGFPIATQVVKVGSSALPVSFTSGWIYLNLNHSAAPGPPIDTAAAQAWVEVMEQNGSQLFNIMHHAQAEDSGTLPNHTVPGH